MANSLCWMVRPPFRGSCPFVSHCPPSCFPLLDGVSAFPRVWSPFNCLPLFPLVGWCVRLPEGLVSLCLALYPFLFSFVGWCVRLSGVLSPLAYDCAPSCFPLLDGVSAFPRVLSKLCLPLPIVPLLVSLCWMVRPPSKGLASPVSQCAHSCFPLLDGVSAFSSVLSALVSHCTPSCFPLLDGVPAFPRVWYHFVSQCTSLFPLVGWCVRLSECVVSPCLPLYPFLLLLVGWRVRLPGGLLSPCLPLYPFLFPFVGWCVRLPEGLVSPCLPLCPFLFPFAEGLVSLCLPLYPFFPFLDGVSAFPAPCLHLSSVVSPLVCLCWMMCLPSRSLVLPLCPNASHWLPTCVPVLDGASAFLTSCLLLPPLVSHCLPTSACVGWCVRLFDVLSPLFVSDCLPTCVPVLDVVLSCLPVLDGVSAFPRSCLPLSPIFSPHVCVHVLDDVFAFPKSCLVACLCSMARPPSRGLVSPYLPLNLLSPIVFHCRPLSPIVSPQVPVSDGASAFPTSCLPFLSPSVSPHVCL